MQIKDKRLILVSPFLIIAINVLVAYSFGHFIGKWAFVPIILIEWCLFMYFVWRYAGKAAIQKWLEKSKGPFAWNLLAMVVCLLPLPVFILHYHTLDTWQVWLPWILLALINPWIEEFYWRGLLLDTTQDWSNTKAILYSTSLFALNHAVFGINSELNSGFTIVIVTFIMGLAWSVVYKKTSSLRWVIFAHFWVDFFNLSSASFLDLYTTGW